MFFMLWLIFKILNYYLFWPMAEIYLEWKLFEKWITDWTFIMKFDSFSLIFSFVVLLITIHIFFYSLSYMALEKENLNFFMLMFFFMSSMLILIFSFNLSSILIGWDGLGITSFLLICFYHSNLSMNSSLITVLINRVGDLMIIMSICIYLIFSTWNLNFFFSNSYWKILFILASFKKKAQLPFSNWLPKAMAAPTPVSSLGHSSTLVTAGVYMIFRLNPIMIYKTKFMFYLCFFTMLLKKIMAILKFDLKEIIAFSTLSHIKIMFMSMSLSNYTGTFFHLCTHALFKALIFMCAGYMIFCSGVQDIRKINFYLLNPMVKFAFFYSIMTMIGVPFLSGFSSKEYIIDNAMEMNSSILNLVLFISILLTSMYSLRFIVIFKKNFATKFKMVYINSTMSKSIISLMIFSLFSGSILQWMFLTLNFSVVLFNLKIFLIGILFMMMLFFFFFNFWNYKTFQFYNLFFCLYFFSFKFFNNKKIYICLEKNWLFFSINFIVQSMNWLNKVFYQKILLF
uniref:NADH:ubiquinone reductase (H(+)-translocating) n=1 Tax=Liposcelis entomophila TaxID=550478 RepID=A0A096X716_9NEOP|nr:NADH dehydrogenase subunit 5 [Liposcelis entomophila]AHA47073.1 NADH dehydrogenase subunit 5 [Liposcelis entomophila]